MSDGIFPLVHIYVYIYVLKYLLTCFNLLSLSAASGTWQTPERNITRITASKWKRSYSTTV